jgi:branched-subunit amino acid ABC-type transport system permease component
MSWGYISGILILTGINLMTVLGLSLLTGFTGLFSFGHAGFMAIGAYTAAMLTLKLNIFPESLAQIQFFLVLPAPLGPIRPKISPSSISKVTLFTAVKPPNCFVRFLRESTLMI